MDDCGIEASSLLATNVNLFQKLIYEITFLLEKKIQIEIYFPGRTTRIYRIDLCPILPFSVPFADINECAEDTGICPKPGRCVNTLGSFKCICPRGFKLDSTGTYCVDTDECLDDSKCPEGKSPIFHH